jgi:hypothetical protein
VGNALELLGFASMRKEFGKIESVMGEMVNSGGSNGGCQVVPQA